jgi:hypothetical protein
VMKSHRGCRPRHLLTTTPPGPDMCKQLPAAGGALAVWLPQLDTLTAQCSHTPVHSCCWQGAVQPHACARLLLAGQLRVRVLHGS